MRNDQQVEMLLLRASRRPERGHDAGVISLDQVHPRRVLTCDPFERVQRRRCLGEHSDLDRRA